MTPDSQPPISALERQTKLAKSVDERLEAVFATLSGEAFDQANADYNAYYSRILNDYGEKAYNVAAFQGIDHNGELTSKKIEADDFAPGDSVVEFLDEFEKKYLKK